MILIILILSPVEAIAQSNNIFRFSQKTGPLPVGIKVVEQYDRSREFTSSADSNGTNPVETWDTHLRRAVLEAGVWTGFLTGAILSGVVAPPFGALELIPTAAALIASAAFSHVERAASNLV
jgi:uncharacterized membrane protein YoaK (UPF0700 family)